MELKHLSEKPQGFQSFLGLEGPIISPESPQFNGNMNMI